MIMRETRLEFPCPAPFPNPCLLSPEACQISAGQSGGFNWKAEDGTTGTPAQCDMEELIPNRIRP